jgi:alpha 1,3-glucosidase
VFYTHTHTHTHAHTHTHTPQETNPEGWFEETFNGHTDSKPSGPEAVSIDLSFPGSQHLYGIPERATNFSLQPTTGVCLFA